MVVIKFGGTSLRDASLIHQAVEIVRALRDRRPVIVVSAMAGVTDALLKAGVAAIGAQPQVREDILWEIRSRHDQAIHQLFGGTDNASVVQEIQRILWEEAQQVFTGVSLLREMSPRSRDLISSFGERLVVPLFAHHLTDRGMHAAAVDARSIIITSGDADFFQIDFDETGRRCRALTEMVESGETPVVTGFICSTPDGITTTLGRGGSDYSASIIGRSINAEEIQIWTDVDGVMTADPRIAPDARVLERISYKEAAEMSSFGAKVLHAQTIMPAADRNIPIRIKNTFAPDAPGTLITAEAKADRRAVKSVTSITGIAIVSVDGRGMTGLPGAAGRVFTAVARRRIGIVMFSQGLSERHISLLVKRSEAEEAVKALRREFELEIERRQIDRIAAAAEAAIIALVGEGISGAPGVAAAALSALSAEGVNVMMIAQGSSDLNLSLVVQEADASRAVVALHQAFDLGRAAE